MTDLERLENNIAQAIWKASQDILPPIAQQTWEQLALVENGLQVRHIYRRKARAALAELINWRTSTEVSDGNS